MWLADTTYWSTVGGVFLFSLRRGLLQTATTFAAISNLHLLVRNRYSKAGNSEHYAVVIGRPDLLPHAVYFNLLFKRAQNYTGQLTRIRENSVYMRLHSIALAFNCCGALRERNLSLISFLLELYPEWPLYRGKKPGKSNVSRATLWPDMNCRHGAAPANLARAQLSLLQHKLPTAIAEKQTKMTSFVARTLQQERSTQWDT